MSRTLVSMAVWGVVFTGLEVINWFGLKPPMTWLLAVCIGILIGAIVTPILLRLAGHK